MSCGVNIPLSSVVEAIIDDYADAFVAEILKRVDLDKLICGCDNHVADFAIDKANDRMTITMRFGEKHHISKSELKEWLGNIASSVVSSGGGGGITGGSLQNNTTIKVNNKDGSTANIDISGLVLPSNASPYIVSGVFVSRDGGYWLDFTRTDNNKVSVDMTDVINKLRQEILGLGYTLKTENAHYTTQAEDFNGYTIIRANRNGDQTITLSKPDDSFVGKALIVRKTNGDVGTLVTLKPAEGVTISPADGSPLRRVGSSATLVYTGEGNWDVFGELP